eukprot:Colp12_sorted_trinity150504_noHs@20983
MNSSVVTRPSLSIVSKVSRNSRRTSSRLRLPEITSGCLSALYLAEMSFSSTTPLWSESRISKACSTSCLRRSFSWPRMPKMNSSKSMAPERSLSKASNTVRTCLADQFRACSEITFTNSLNSILPLLSSSAMRNLRLIPAMPRAPWEFKDSLRTARSCTGSSREGVITAGAAMTGSGTGTTFSLPFLRDSTEAAALAQEGAMVLSRALASSSESWTTSPGMMGTSMERDSWVRAFWRAAALAASATMAATITVSTWAASLLAANTMVDSSGEEVMTLPEMLSPTRALATAAVTASGARSPPMITPTLPTTGAFLVTGGVGAPALAAGDVPGVAHHELEVVVIVDGGGAVAVVLDELL